MSIKTITKCAVWIYGSEFDGSVWHEDRILKHQDGFVSEAEAKRWAQSAKNRLTVPGKTQAERYKIGPSY